jgi:hypothetical protein
MTKKQIHEKTKIPDRTLQRWEKSQDWRGNLYKQIVFWLKQDELLKEYKTIKKDLLEGE